MKEAIKEGSAKLARSRKARFGAVGVINTAVDLVVLNLLVMLGLPLFWANMGSTTAAMTTSFTLNKRAVFPDGAGSTRRQAVLFVIVTLVGVWGVQGGVLALAHLMLQSTGWSEPVLVTVSKVVGICFGLIWNYLWYSRFVFRKGSA